MNEPTHPLKIGIYRRFILARFLAVVAGTSLVVLLGYQLYDVARADYGMSRSQAAFQLGVMGLVQFVPFFICTPIAGIAADRFDRRMVVAISSLGDAFLAGLLAYLTWHDDLTLLILFGIAAGHGAVRAFTGPALMAIAPNIVPPNLLPKAIATSSVVFTVGAVSGPALGGFLYAVDASLPHFISALFFLTTTAVMLTLRRLQAKQSEHPVHPVRQMIEGFQFIWKERFLLGCVTLDLFAVILGGATAMLPVFARDILMVGPEGLGIMRGMPAAGAGLVALWFSFRPLDNNVGVKMLAGVVIFGLATVGFGLSRNYLLSLFFLGLLGAADMVSVFIRNTLVQLRTPDEMRGRVSSINGVAISASNELGEMRAGLSAAVMGVTGAVVFGGLGAIIVTLIWARIFPELRRVKTFDPPEWLENPREIAK